MLKDFISKLKRVHVIKKNEIVVDANEYLRLVAKATERPKLTKEPLLITEYTKEHITSYLPNYEHLSGKSDEFKTGLGKFCKDTKDSQYFKYLMEHFKQDIVNYFLHHGGEEKYMRGGLNGVDVVEKMITSLGNAYVPPKGIQKKTKEES